MICKIIDWLIHKYTSEKITIEKKKMHQCGDGFLIEYPFIISHPEMIEIGDNVELHSQSRIQLFPELVDNSDFRIVIGNGCFFGYRNSILAGAEIIIGDNVMCGSDVVIISYNHGIDLSLNIPFQDQMLVAKPITIGKNCWLGDKTMILPGVNIGNNTVVGGGSVVTKDLPQNVVALGNPARIVRHLDN